MSRLLLRPSASEVDLTVRLGPLTLPNPIVAASGTFGHGAELAELVDPSELGAVTVKSLSAEPWTGNPAPRLCPAPAGMLNSVGLQNPGVASWRDRELPALLAHGTRVVASVWGHTVDDFGRAAAELRPVRERLVALEVNVSCPNLDDRSRMFSCRADSTAAAVRATAVHAGKLPIFVKLTSNTADLVEVASAALGAGAIGLTLINTVPGLAIDAETRRPRLGAGGGGLSGPAIKPVALRAVWEASRALPGVPIIGTGGVASGTDAVEMLLAGASAVGVGTATFREPRATLRILRELERWCARRDVAAVSELVGRLEEPR